LYRYCYLVASVVGLVCIRIFGYSDPAANLLAEKTGVAFQLTNILRDVKEDAERKRIYLPQDLLEEFGILNADVMALAGGRAIKENERAMLVALSARAWEYYGAAQELLPMIDAESRAALWVLVEIYSGLLKRIDLRGGDVFSGRVSVPTSGKMFALLRGAVMSMRARRA
jgi:phytoene synthase